jgi:hypothetical protein
MRQHGQKRRVRLMEHDLYGLGLADPYLARARPTRLPSAGFPL